MVDPGHKVDRMNRFGQQTKLVAAAGQSDALVAKFLESALIQHDNPACDLLIAGKSTTEDDVVFLVEVWASEADWERARSSDEIAEWAKGMPGLVAAPPESVRFNPAGGKGLPM
jgi:quinol monooxygenase YgiN